MALNKDAVRRTLRYRWAVFGILAFAYFFVYFHRVSPAVVSNFLQISLGVGAASIAVLSSIYFYAYTVMQLPSGLLADKWGPRRTVSAFTLLAATGAFLTGVATNFELVMLGRLLIGIGVAAVYIPIMKILATWYRKNEFASLSGILLAVGNLGGLSAAGPLVLMSEAFGWQQVFIILGIITTIIAAAAWIITRDRPSELSLPTIQEIEDEESGRMDSNPSTSETLSMKQALRMTFGSGRRFWPLAIWFFFTYGSMMVYQGLWAGPFFKDVMGWDNATIGTVLTFIGIGMIVSCPISGYISDKILRSRRKVLIIGAVTYTIVWAAIWLMAGHTDSVEAYMVVNFLFGFFGGFFIVSYAQVKELFPIAIVGTTTAALNIFPFAGGAILQQVTGLMLIDRSVASYQGIWLFMLVCMVLATAMVFLSKERTLSAE
ncbi:MAG: MFS transporter [Methanomassiliicoccus sp.]|nr:MFS transporter [Methanomassiliicoccus sp.]